ncbi:hypothetical protein GCK72_003478 [Caenorhabditis remanei]|uniref:Uncharacterized protein n=1 Tax=Caenorhabditis remanei TaxID=31234 RepID=A0A6A5HWI3_CAERE|nr:hypothetical protein GCK72_003478 [Caenorhabditis remanei]KAF1771651.1 hypothetical protein GCK72_003478 [Caenorhabditis remanei]
MSKIINCRRYLRMPECYSVCASSYSDVLRFLDINTYKISWEDWSTEEEFCHHCSSRPDINRVRVVSGSKNELRSTIVTGADSFKTPVSGSMSRFCGLMSRWQIPIPWILNINFRSDGDSSKRCEAMGYRRRDTEMKIVRRKLLDGVSGVLERWAAPMQNGSDDTRRIVAGQNQTPLIDIWDVPPDFALIPPIFDPLNTQIG